MSAGILFQAKEHDRKRHSSLLTPGSDRSIGWDTRFNEIREIRKGDPIYIYVSHQNMLIQNDINDEALIRLIVFTV